MKCTGIWFSTTSSKTVGLVIAHRVHLRHETGRVERKDGSLFYEDTLTDRMRRERIPPRCETPPTFERVGPLENDIPAAAQRALLL